MVNFKAWDLATDLTVAQATCLWCCVEPRPAFTLIRLEHPETEAIYQLLVSAIRSGDLPLVYESPLASISNHESSAVSRRDLLRFAKAVGQRPLFLFPDQRGSETEPSNTVVDTDSTKATTELFPTQAAFRVAPIGRKTTAETRTQTIWDEFDKIQNAGSFTFEHGELTAVSREIAAAVDYEQNSVEKEIRARYRELEKAAKETGGSLSQTE